MRYEDNEEAKRLNAEPWQLALLKANPSYCGWGPHEDYMGGKGEGWNSRIIVPTWAEFGPWNLDELNECANFCSRRSCIAVIAGFHAPLPLTDVAPATRSPWPRNVVFTIAASRFPASSACTESDQCPGTEPRCSRASQTARMTALHRHPAGIAQSAAPEQMPGLQPRPR